jgi:parvulin-like peptidyl-prolyl isomerase
LGSCWPSLLILRTLSGKGVRMPDKLVVSGSNFFPWEGVDLMSVPRSNRDGDNLRIDPRKGKQQTTVMLEFCKGAKQNMKSFKSSALALALVAAGCLTSPMVPSIYAAPVNPDKTVQEAPKEQVKEVKALEIDAEMVKIGDKVFTVDDLMLYHSLRPTNNQMLRNPKAVGMLRGDDLESLAKHLGAADLMAEKAKAEGVELTEEQQEQAESRANIFIQSALFKMVVTDNLTEPTEEELKELYESQKDTAFHKEEVMRMRHLFVSTYEDYSVQAGDTLESIAIEISGDESAAEKILSMETKRPRSEGLGEKDDKEKPLDPRALLEGEELKVPLVKGPRVEAAQKKVDDAWAKLEEGGSFSDLAKEYSENDNPGSLWTIKPASQERPIMDSIKDAFFELEDQSYSKPMRTKHGFQIVYRENYQPEEITPFEDVKDKLDEGFKRDQTQSVIGAFFKGLAEDTEVVQIDSETLAKTGEDASKEDVIVTIGEATFNRELMANYLRSDVEGKTEVEIREVIQKVGPVQRAMLDVYMVKQGLKDSDAYKEGLVASIDSQLADVYLKAKVEELVGEPTDEEIQAYYDENKQYFETKEAYTLYGACVVDEDEAKATTELTTALAGIQNIEDFKAAVDLVNPKERFPQAGGFMGKVMADDLTEEDLEVIRETTVPGISPVVYQNGEAIVYWVDTLQDYQLKPLEEVKKTIAEQLKSSAQSKKFEEILDEYKNLVQVELLVD